MSNLYKHQEKILFENPLKTGLWLGTGSGKTRIALLLSCGKTLVICPKTQKEDKNWEREYAKLGLKNLLTVKSKEEFKKIASTYTAQFETIIIDEAHTCLGVTPSTRQRKRQIIPKASQLYESIEEYLQKYPPKRLYLVTATIIRSPMTVWAAAKLLGHSYNFYEWRTAFYTQLPMPGREVWAPRSDNFTKDRLATVVKKIGYIGRLEEYFDVPEQTYKTIYIELTAEQKSRIKEIKIEYPDPIVFVGKQHQIEQGVLKGNEFAPSEIFANNKIEKIKELALEFPRMIIFAKYTAQIEAIATVMKKEGKKVFILDGTTKDRGSLFAEANNTKEYVFVAQSQVSAGWELPECPVMVFASMSYSVVDRIQGEGRILRANALKKNLYIDIITKGGVDEAVYKSIKNKQDFSERLYAGI